MASINSLPVELSKEIVLYFFPGKDLNNLRSLACVSRVWNALATPQLYHTVDLLVLQTLLVNPDLGRHVRSVELPYIDSAAYMRGLRSYINGNLGVESEPEVDDTAFPEPSGALSGWEAPHALYRRYRYRSDNDGRAVRWKHSLLAESNIVMPSQAQIAEFKLEKHLLDELRARNKVAQAVLLLHLLPALQILDVMWLCEGDSYVLCSVPDPLASIGGFNGVVPVGYANVTRLSFGLWTWCDMDIESVRKIFSLPSLKSVSFSGTNCGEEWSVAPEGRLSSLYGTSSVTEIHIERCFVAPNALVNLIRLPRRLCSMRCEDVQGDVDEYDLDVVGAALRHHKESLVELCLDMVASLHSETSIAEDHTIHSLGSFHDFTSLRTLEARYSDIVGGLEHATVQIQRLAQLLPSSLRELTVYDSCLQLSTLEDGRSISDMLRFDDIQCREDCPQLQALRWQFESPVRRDACFN